MAKTKRILNAKLEFLRDELLTEEELTIHTGKEKLIQIDSSDGIVICDYCDKDYTHSNETGGVIFERNAACPDCAPRLEANNNELQHIKYRCPSEISFADWIRFLRKNHSEEITFHLKIFPNKNSSIES